MAKIGVVGRAIVVSVALSAVVSAARGQVAAETPLKVAVCALQANPATYNHKLIEISGVVSHGFERFSVSDARCAQRPGVWLEYGGTANSGTTYCCGVSAARTRSETLVVEGIAVPLVRDAIFRRFDARIQSAGDVVVHATLLGRFFAGRQHQLASGGFGAGYGHLGCCSLLAVQQVLAIDVPKTSVGADAVSKFFSWTVDVILSKLNLHFYSSNTTDVALDGQGPQ